MKDLFILIGQGQIDRLREHFKENPQAALARNSAGVTALMWAIYYRNPDTIALLREYVNELSIYEASALGDVKRIEKLLGESYQLVNGSSPDGFSPLHLASFFGQVDAVSCLLLHGAQVNARGPGTGELRPLHSACAGADGAKALLIARELIQAGADFNARQKGGFTPLHSAAANNFIELAEFLVKRGASLEAHTDEGKTPQDVAREAGHHGLAMKLDPARA